MVILKSIRLWYILRSRKWVCVMHFSFELLTIGRFMEGLNDSKNLNDSKKLNKSSILICCFSFAFHSKNHSD